MPSRPERVSFRLVRVDDRLLHGQVVLNWVRLLRPRIVAVVDDALAERPEIATLLADTLPAGVTLWVGRIAEAPEALLGPTASAPADALLLVRGPAEAAALFAAGLHYGALNLGTLGSAPGRVRAGQQLYLSRTEVALLQRLAAAGVDVSAQALPNAPRIPLEELICRVSRASSA